MAKRNTDTSARADQLKEDLRHLSETVEELVNATSKDASSDHDKPKPSYHIIVVYERAKNGLDLSRYGIHAPKSKTEGSADEEKPLVLQQVQDALLFRVYIRWGAV